MNDNRQRHVVVVDDDAELRAMLVAYLEKNGIGATAMASGDELLRRIARLRPDLVVLDLMMPGASGLEVCRKLRADGDDVPLILLTARSDDVDRILGLEMGADDYLGKPFNPRELLARIQAVLRRRPESSRASQPVATGGTVAVGTSTLDLASRRLRHGDTETVLSDSEFGLLRVFVEHPNVLLTRQRLIEMTQGRASEVLERSIDVSILRLRRLVEPDPQQPLYIQTVRGKGYVYVPCA